MKITVYGWVGLLSELATYEMGEFYEETIKTILTVYIISHMGG